MKTTITKLKQVINEEVQQILFELTPAQRKILNNRSEEGALGTPNVQDPRFTKNIAKSAEGTFDATTTSKAPAPSLVTQPVPKAQPVKRSDADKATLKNLGIDPNAAGSASASDSLIAPDETAKAVKQPAAKVKPVKPVRQPAVKQPKAKPLTQKGADDLFKDLDKKAPVPKVKPAVKPAAKVKPAVKPAAKETESDGVEPKWSSTYRNTTNVKDRKAAWGQMSKAQRNVIKKYSAQDIDNMPGAKATESDGFEAKGKPYKNKAGQMVQRFVKLDADGKGSTIQQRPVKQPKAKPAVTPVKQSAELPLPKPGDSDYWNRTPIENVNKQYEFMKNKAWKGNLTDSGRKQFNQIQDRRENHRIKNAPFEEIKADAKKFQGREDKGNLTKSGQKTLKRLLQRLKTGK